MPGLLPNFDSFQAGFLIRAFQHVPSHRGCQIVATLSKAGFASKTGLKLDRGSDVIAAIANFREGEKHDPHYYAEVTVRKAAASLGLPDGARCAPER